MLQARFTSRARIELLSTFLHDERDFYVGQLERITGEDYKNIPLNFEGYSERRTITYTPVTGRAVARRLYSPIPVEVVFSLAQAG